jgi:integrase
LPRVAKPLTIRQIEQAKLGMHADGHGLYLAVGENSKSWVFRYKLGDRRREMGLGSFEMLTYVLQNGQALTGVAAAREIAVDLSRKVAAGIDPIDEKRTARAPTRRIPTFRECAEAYIAAHESGWRDKKAWPDSLRLYAYPIIGDVRVDAIDDNRVLACLEPIWLTRNTTAGRVRGRIETILEFARFKKYRPEGLNPARWKDHLEYQLASPGAEPQEHHAALPWRNVPAFMKQLASDDGVPAAAVAFAILTATRASEAAETRWCEIDMVARIWTIPARRMKANEEHRVPLPDAAMAILHRMAAIKSNSDDRVFLPRNEGGKMRPQAMLKAVRRVNPDITLHGFRSAFRDWCADTRKDRDLAEEALAHAVGNAVERAYRRTELLELRRELMAAWAAWCGI